MKISSFVEKILSIRDAYKVDNIPSSEKTILSGNVQPVITEQYRLLRSRLVNLNGNHGNKVIAVTSTRKGEGKSLTSVNLAIVMAEDTKKKVLLIDGDMRKPAVHTFFDCKAEYGFSDLLSNKVDIESAIIHSNIRNLTLLLAGRLLESSAELIATASLKENIEKLRKKFDYIIIDSPPIIPFADMSVFGDVVDGILLVIRAERTPKESVVEALKALNKENVLGIVFNDSKRRLSKEYY